MGETMNDTEITVVGTVLTRPERRRTEKTNAVVTSFKIVSNSRRFDKETGQWIDGSTFRVRVNCWRRLADNVAGSVFVGDPVIVKGRIITRDWRNEQDEPRTTYNLDAITVGHDLNRGQATFVKPKPQSGGTVVDEADDHVNGEPTELLGGPAAPFGVDPDEAEASVDDFAFGEYAAGTTAAGTVDPGTVDPGTVDTGGGHADAASILAGLDPRSPEDDVDEDEGELVGATAGSGGSSGRGRRRGR
jgi:single-strand DNA-binding protein